MTEDARKDLTDFVARWKQHAEESAARLDASDEDDIQLFDSVESSVESLIQIIDEYEKMARWFWRRPRRQIPPNLEPFIPGGIAHLTGTLLAAISIGRLAPNDPILKEKLDALLRTSMERARGNRHPGSEEKNAKLAALYAQGMSGSQIAKELGIEKGTAQRQIRRMIDDGRIQERES